MILHHGPRQPGIRHDLIELSHQDGLPHSRIVFEWRIRLDQFADGVPKWEICSLHDVVSAGDWSAGAREYGRATMKDAPRTVPCVASGLPDQASHSRKRQMWSELIASRSPMFGQLGVLILRCLSRQNTKPLRASQMMWMRWVVAASCAAAAGRLLHRRRSISGSDRAIQSQAALSH